MTALADTLRGGDRTVGYWVLSDNPQAVERIAGTEVAAQRFAEGFTWVSIASDLTHLEQAARAHLGASGR